MKSFTTVLPKRVVKQPTPEVCAGGDCGACVVAGLTGIPVPDVYKWNERDRKAVIDAFSWPTMRDVLYQLFAHHKIERFVDTVPMFLDIRPSSSWIWGSPSWTMNLGWFNWVTLAIQAGFYGVVAVDSQRRGPLGDGAGGDHWIMICGVREIWPEHEGVIEKEILISNSSRAAADEEWVRHDTFLKTWGGYNVLLVKPLPDPEYKLAS